MTLDFNSAMESAARSNLETSSTWKTDLKKKNPKKFADYQIAGTIDKMWLRKIVKALSMMSLMNTPEETKRLAAAKRLLKDKY